MTADLLTRQALDRHLWKYSLVTLAVVIPATALVMELPARRLRRVARTARRITAGDLQARTGMGRRGGDEITEIAATVDAMADSLRDRLAGEQRFTADVAHELRTPLMGLVTSAGLLPEGRRPNWSGTGCGCCATSSRTCWRSPASTPARNGSSHGGCPGRADRGLGGPHRPPGDGHRDRCPGGRD